MRHSDIKRTAKYLLQAAVIGIVGGLIFCFYNFCSKHVTSLWKAEGDLMFSIAMPVIGLLIVLTERLFKLEGMGGSNAVIIESGGKDAKIPLRASACSFITLLLTNLAETVTGREGASWQLVSPIAKRINDKWFPDTQKRIAVSCAIAAGFGCLWGLPLFGAFIASEMAFASLYFPAFVPSLLSSYIARGMALLIFPNQTVHEVAAFEPLDTAEIAKLAGISILVGLFARAYICVSDKIGDCFSLIKNTYVRIFAGGALIGVLCYFVGKDYLCGVNVLMNDALLGRPIPWYSFLAKIFFFCVLLKSGYKTGVLIQTMSIGAMLGPVLSGFSGLPAGLSAAVSLAGLVGASFNAPLTAAALSLEIFGGEVFPYCVIAIFFARIVSGNCRKYTGQEISDKMPLIVWE